MSFFELKIDFFDIVHTDLHIPGKRYSPRVPPYAVITSYGIQTASFMPFSRKSDTVAVNRNPVEAAMEIKTGYDDLMSQAKPTLLDVAKQLTQSQIYCQTLNDDRDHGVDAETCEMFRSIKQNETQFFEEYFGRQPLLDFQTAYRALTSVSGRTSFDTRALPYISKPWAQRLA